MKPGDVFELSGGEIRSLPAASEVAFTNCEDGAQIEFDPTAPIPDLCDPNPEGYAVERMMEVIGQFIGEGLATTLRADIRARTPCYDFIDSIGCDTKSRLYCHLGTPRPPPARAGMRCAIGSSSATMRCES
jgi:hypothetical protein